MSVGVRVWLCVFVCVFDGLVVDIIEADLESAEIACEQNVSVTRKRHNGLNRIVGMKAVVMTTPCYRSAHGTPISSVFWLRLVAVSVCDYNGGGPLSRKNVPNLV